MTNFKIKTIIVDDNVRIRSLVRELLEDEDSIHVCAEAANLKEAQNLLILEQPDVAVFDLLLQEHSADFFLNEINRMSLKTKIVIFSAHSESIYAKRCLAAGASGYVCKDKAVQSLGQAIRTVFGGKTFIS